MTTRLSVAAVERLKPDPNKRREIADAGKPGLYLVIQPTGARSWAVRYRFNGEARKLTLRGFPSLDLARKLAQHALDDVASGQDPAAEQKAARNTPSTLIDAVFAEFLAKHRRKRNGKPIRESTRRETGRLLGFKASVPDLTAWEPRTPKSGVLAHWTGRDVLTITKRDVLQLLDRIIDSGAPIGANRALAALKTFFGWCVQQDVLAASPCAHVNDPSPEESRQRSLSDQELVALWRAAIGQGYPYGQMVRLLVATGQRRDEVREGIRGEFDLAARTWKIPGTRTKNGREHHVPLSDLAMAILEGLPEIESKKARAWLFTIDGDVAVSNLARRKARLDKAMLAELRKADPEAELEPFTLHDLRHTLKTFMQRVRIPEDVRNAVQNHWDGDMDELYGHYTFDKEKRDALDAWARHIDALLSGEIAANVVRLNAAARTA